MDAFVRPTATPQRVAPWLAELRRSARGLVGAYVPFSRRVDGVLGASRREQVVLAVAEINGCRYTAWVHGAWRDLLGPDQHDEAFEALLDYARASALAGAPVETDHLESRLPTEVIRSVRATVAVAEVSSLVGNTADALAARLRGARPIEPAGLVREVAVILASLPVAAPLLAAGGAMRLAVRIAPPMPAIERPPDGEASLVVEMLVEAVRSWLATPLARLVLLALPRPLVVGVRAEGSAATLRISRQRIRFSEGLASDAVVVLDGALDLLVDVAARALDREVRALSVRT